MRERFRFGVVRMPRSLPTRIPTVPTSRLSAFVLAAVILTGACQRENAPRMPGDTGLALATSAHSKDSLILLKDSILAERQRQLSEQGALIGDAVTSARLVTEISTTLAKVRNLKVPKDSSGTESAVSTASAELVTIQAKVDALIKRLNASESRVRRMRQDSVTLSEATAAQLRGYEQSIAELRASVDQQRAEIGVLTTRVDSIATANRILVARGDSLSTVNRAMAAREDSVFVAIGTEKELAAKGIVRREGGTLWFFGRGKAMVPGRSPDMTAFRVLSKQGDHTITLPQADKEYTLVSRHDLAHTDAAGAKGGRIKGALRITDAERFWAPSKYLILVQR